MKLEAGKKYVTGYGEILECVAVWIKPVNGHQATLSNMHEGLNNYTIDGKWAPPGESKHDIVSEYKEPKKYQAWVNLYSDGFASLHLDKHIADASKNDRIECRKIE